MEIEVERHNKNLFLTLSTAVHLIGFLNFWIALSFRTYYAVTHDEFTLYHKIGLNFKNANSINAVIQALYNSFALYVDIVIWNTYTRDAPLNYYTIRSHFRLAVAFPFGVFVTVMYWMSMWINKGGLITKHTTERGKWLGHMMHSTSPFLLLLDILFCSGESPSWLISLFIIATIDIAYFIFIHILHLFTGIWVYPMLQNLSFVTKLLFCAMVIAMMLSVFFLGSLLNDFLWEQEGCRLIKCCKKQSEEHKQGSEHHRKRWSFLSSKPPSNKPT